MEFLLNSANLSFTIALGLMLGIGPFEAVITLLDAGRSNFIDSLLPDVDLDVDLSVAAAANGHKTIEGGNLTDQIVNSGPRYHGQAPLADAIGKEEGMTGSEIHGLTHSPQEKFRVKEATVTRRERFPLT